VASTQVELELVALTKQAQQDVKKFADTAQKQLSGISMAATFTALAEAFALFSEAGSRAFDAVKGGFDKAIEEARQAEEANIRLANSLRLAGDFSKENVERFDAFAAAIQKTTTVSDKQAISALSLAKSFHASNEEAEKIVLIATDLSAKLGEDLNTSVVRLGRTLEGQKDRELLRYFSGLKSISDQQLVAGAGLDFIAGKVKGTASALTNSFGGALQQAHNAFDKVFEEFGLAIIQTPEVIAGIRSLGAEFGVLATAVARAAPSIASFVGSLIKFTATAAQVYLQTEKVYFQFIAAVEAGYEYLADIFREIPTLLTGFFHLVVDDSKKGVKQLEEVFGSLDPKKLFAKFRRNEGDVDAVFDPLINAAKKVKDDVENVKKQVADAAKLNAPTDDGKAARERAAELERTKILEQYTAQRKEIELAALSETARVNKEYVDKETLVRKAANLGLITDKAQMEKLILGLETERLKKLQEIQLRVRSEAEAAEAKFDADRRKKYEDYAKEPIKQLILFGTQLDRDSAIALGAGLLADMAKGMKGAQDLITKGIGQGLSYALTGSDVLSGPISEIADLLAQGPDQTKKMIDEFIDGIPVIIENMIKALPVLLEEIAEKLPPALAKVAPQMAIGFTTAIVSHIPEIIKAFVNGLIQAAKDFVQELINQISDLGGGALGGLTGSGDSQSIFAGIPVLQGVGDLFGFADGGRIPNIAKFANDRGLAKVTADEQILNPDLTRRLENYLDANEGGGSGPQVAILKLNDRELARAYFRADKNGNRLRYNPA
jgi:hypothetical protein